MVEEASAQEVKAAGSSSPVATVDAAGSSSASLPNAEPVGKRGPVGRLALVVALVAIGGQIFTIGWTIWWNMHQDGQRSAGQFPALQVKIAVEHPQSSAQPLTKDQNERLIKGIVAIKNVGTSKTNLQLCECVRTEEEADEQRDIFLGPCKAPKAEE